MWYENLDNPISQDYKYEVYDKTRIVITKKYLTNNYTLKWFDCFLWGKTFMEKEFVRYNTIRIFDNVPDELED